MNDEQRATFWRAVEDYAAAREEAGGVFALESVVKEIESAAREGFRDQVRKLLMRVGKLEETATERNKKIAELEALAAQRRYEIDAHAGLRTAFESAAEAEGRRREMKTHYFALVGPLLGLTEGWESRCPTLASVTREELQERAVARVEALLAAERSLNELITAWMAPPGPGSWELRSCDLMEALADRRVNKEAESERAPDEAPTPAPDDFDLCATCMAYACTGQCRCTKCHLDAALHELGAPHDPGACGHRHADPDDAK